MFVKFQSIDWCAFTSNYAAAATEREGFHKMLRSRKRRWSETAITRGGERSFNVAESMVWCVCVGGGVRTTHALTLLPRSFVVTPGA